VNTSPLSIEMPEMCSLRPDIVERFNQWLIISKNCPMRKPVMPIDFCMCIGNPCCFMHCPRRLYEEPRVQEVTIIVYERSHALSCSFIVQRMVALASEIVVT